MRTGDVYVAFNSNGTLRWKKNPRMSRGPNHIHFSISGCVLDCHKLGNSASDIYKLSGAKDILDSFNIPWCALKQGSSVEYKLPDETFVSAVHWLFSLSGPLPGELLELFHGEEVAPDPLAICYGGIPNA
jgi:hypothetical protein